MAFGSGSSFGRDCSTRRRGSPSSLKLCKFGCSAPPALVLKAHNPLGLILRQPHQSISSSFFLAYSGSGEVIQCLALCQRTPVRAKVARTVSPDTRSSVSPSSKLTSAAISIVHKLLCLPNSLGLL